MITLKVQLYWARVERWIASGTFALGFNFTNHPRDSEAARQRKLFVLMRTIPDAKLKKPPPKKGGRLFWVCIKIYRAHGSLYAKQTFNRIAANDCFKLNLANAAEIPNSVKLHHVAA
jgi:hypothetical protein